MAARKLKPYHDEHTRDAIQATQLVKRLQGHALGQLTMTPSQIMAALGLLKKRLPDLMATEISGSIEIPNVVRAPMVAADSPDWSSTYRPVPKPVDKQLN